MDYVHYTFILCANGQSECTCVPAFTSMSHRVAHGTGHQGRYLAPAIAQHYAEATHLMSDHQKVPNRNPVDAWWTTTRAEIKPCITMLACYPVARSHGQIDQYLSIVSTACDYIRNAPCPEQAESARDTLVDALTHLIESLEEQRTPGPNDSHSTHTLAVQKYTTVTYLLLQRGIYEPVPSLHEA